MKAKNSPTADSEKATGKPISMNTIKAPNISGAIISKGKFSVPLHVEVAGYCSGRS